MLELGSHPTENDHLEGLPLEGPKAQFGAIRAAGFNPEVPRIGWSQLLRVMGCNIGWENLEENHGDRRGPIF